MSARVWIGLLYGIILVFVTAIECYAPLFARRDIFFGVTVAPNARATPSAQRIIARYRLAVIAIGALGVLTLALALALTTALDESLVIVGLVAVLILWIGALSIPYFWAHAAARALVASGATGTPPATQPPVATLRPRRYSDYLPWAWEALPLALIVATFAALAWQYPHAPATLIIHWNAQGKPNGFARKTPLSYYGEALTMLPIYALLFGLGYLIARSRAQPDAADLRFKRLMVRFLFGMRTLLVALFGAIALVIASQTSPQWVIALPIVIIVLVLVTVTTLAFRVGQGGARLRDTSASPTDRMADRYWKWGIFYVNPDDPSIMVERRFGMGYTVNFGSPTAVVTFFLLIGVPIALTLMISIFATR
ncbi:MAG TPA: DUF5808 domain-containing protein [Ktedonobacterales bacterium]|nr:DUF5808 domain-containing protein [Ktedonobacterales bacterium]